MSVRNALTKLVLGRDKAEAITAARVARSPDRKLMLEDYLPAFAAGGGRILWVGCKLYTADYPALLETQGAEVWTTDIDARVEGYGRAGRHRTGDISEADTLFADLAFDAVLCNGILGFGVDRPEDQRMTLRALWKITAPGGRLLLGWNTDRIADPLGLAAPEFAPEPLGDLPARVEVPGVTHVYDLLIRREGVA